jgi:mRNA-degrading endonuclease RelE of RelBE toxin-antitoxin system
VNDKVHTWPAFDEALAKLRKKYPRIDEDLHSIVPGHVVRMDPLPGYSHKLWKIRIPSRDMGHGKRGGFRLIVYIDPAKLNPAEPREMHLLTIYAKNEREDISREELLHLWSRFLEHLKVLRAR